MSFRNRLAAFLVIVLVAGAVSALFAPFLVANGIRVWLLWAAKEEGLSVEIEKVEAPFLREIALQGLEVTPAKAASHDIHLRAAKVMLDLNFRGWIFSHRGRLLRSISANHLVGSVHVAQRRHAQKLDWRKLKQLLPDNVRLEDLDLDIVTPATALSFRGVALSASEIESGKFLAHRIFVTSPILRQTFVDLRGATSWESARLTIAGISLARGLDLESLTLDLSQMAKRRLGLDLHLDTFGGTLRASFQGRAGEKFAIDLAGTAANISLAQISQAVGFLEPITGSVRASKFTFRGHPGEFLDATASIWIELADFGWRARRADNVMLGATYYARRLEVDQLYVQQRQNELTINGELLWPSNKISWSQLPFRGQLNASIPDLNAFAQFFGATTGDFGGELFAEGALDLLDPAAHGRLALRGQEVSFRGVLLDSLGASIQLSGSEATLENLEARHGDDFVRGHGVLDFASPHHYSARLTGAVGDLGVYRPLLPAAWRSSKIGGGATFDWNGDGTLAVHSGTIQLFAHGLQLPVAPLRMPLDVTLEGTYSPQDIFFRTFRLASDRVSLGGFLMLGSNFVELQALELTLDGAPRVSGTLFLPFSVDRLRKSRRLLDAFDARQKFDLDLAVNHLDLAQLASVLGENPPVAGLLEGKLAAFGALPSLQLTTNWHLENFEPNADSGDDKARDSGASSKNSIDFQCTYGDGRVDADARAVFGVSDPVTLRASLPLRLEKGRIAAGTMLDLAEQFSVALDFPALFFDTLPNDPRPLGAESGLLSGSIAFSNTLENPKISGVAQVLHAKLDLPAPWPALSNLAAQVRFGDNQAAIDPLRFEINSVPIDLRARLTTTSRTFALSLTPAESAIGLVGLPSSGASVSVVRMLGEGSSEDEPKLREALVRGRIGSAAASLTITAEPRVEEALFPFRTTLFFHPKARDASPLLLEVSPIEEPRTPEL